MSTYRTYKQSTYWYPDDWTHIIEKKTCGIWIRWASFGYQSSFDEAVEQLKSNGHVVISRY